MEIGTNVNLKKEELYVKNEVICQRMIRTSSKENPFNVTGKCDICDRDSERMSLATYTFPKDVGCLCCNGRPHSIIIKFCKDCTPPSMQQMVENRRYHQMNAVRDLIKTHSKDFKRILAKHQAKNYVIHGSNDNFNIMMHSHSSGIYLDGNNEIR